MAAVHLSGGVSQGAVTLADFESGTSPVQNWGVVSLATATAPSPGTGGWGDATVSQYWGEMTIPSWATGNLTVANLNSHSKVEFDLILPSSGWLGSNVNIRVEFQLNGGAAYSSGWATTNVSASKDQIVHFTFDYSAAGTFPAATAGPDITLNINPGYEWMWDGANTSGTAYTPQQVYVDNIQLTGVPEPGVAALGGLGVLGLLIRKRR